MPNSLKLLIVVCAAVGFLLGFYTFAKASSFCPIVDANGQWITDTTCQRMEELEQRQQDLENQYRRDKLNREIQCIQSGGC